MTTSEAAPRGASHSGMSPFVEKKNGAPSDGIVAVTVTVNEPDAASAMLEMARVPHEEHSGRVVVPATAAHGVVLEFAED